MGYGYGGGYAMAYGGSGTSGYSYTAGYAGPVTSGYGGPASNAPATVVVQLPATAKLMIDGNPTRSTSDMRIFISPPLQAGQEYVYTLKAELPGEGTPRTETKEVTVRPGAETRVRFDLSPTRVIQE
jgi:uncharacterized protein (TIGR03000 family)